MVFGKKKYQIIFGKLLCPIPQLGDSPFTVNCFVYLEGDEAGSSKWGDASDRSKFHLELHLQELDDNPENKVNSASRDPVTTSVDGLGGLTSASGRDAKVTENGGLRFDLDRLYIDPNIDKGTFRIHAKLFRAHFGLLDELLAEADSEPFTRGDMAKHKLPEGWEMFQGCGGMR